jgi:hypothetical protein
MKTCFKQWESVEAYLSMQLCILHRQSQATGNHPSVSPNFVIPNCL